MNITHTITRERTIFNGPLCISTTDAEEEIEIVAECKVSRGMKGSRDSFGVPMEPDGEPEVEIISVTPDHELTESEIEAITEKAFQQAADDIDDREFERD